MAQRTIALAASMLSISTHQAAATRLRMAGCIGKSSISIKHRHLTAAASLAASSMMAA